MEKPNKKHRNFINEILKCDDNDILQHRMLRLPFLRTASIETGWTCYARFTFNDGKVFRASWCLKGQKELKNCFKDMLSYMRKIRRTK